MIIKKAKNNEVTFAFTEKPNARKVYIAGDFNDWDDSKRRMVKVKDGSFRARMKLEPGEYEYKYIVDGEWCADPDAPTQRSNPFGTVNSVVQV